VWCSVVQCGAVCCSVVQCGAVCCSVVQCVAVCCSVVQCGAVWCSVVRCGAVFCGIVQCSAVSGKLYWNGYTCWKQKKISNFLRICFPYRRRAGVLNSHIFFIMCTCTECTQIKSHGVSTVCFQKSAQWSYDIIWLQQTATQKTKNRYCTFFPWKVGSPFNWKWYDFWVDFW